MEHLRLFEFFYSDRSNLVYNDRVVIWPKLTGLVLIEFVTDDWQTQFGPIQYFLCDLLDLSKPWLNIYSLSFFPVTLTLRNIIELPWGDAKRKFQVVHNFARIQPWDETSNIKHSAWLGGH